jgi:hypothetical protein
MMATTIIISTNVKPALRDVLIFILALAFLFCGVNSNNRRVIDYYGHLFTYCLLQPQCVKSTMDANGFARMHVVGLVR